MVSISSSNDPTPHHNLTVAEDYDQLRVDVYLTKVLDDIPSRSFVKRLIDEGQVSVNNKKVKAHYKVSLGDEVAVNVIEKPLNEFLKPENIPLDVLYEDESILVVNKPIGILVHPANDKNTSGTLVNALLHHCKSLSDVNTPVRPGIVHRLDKETSGVMVVAKNNKAHVRLARQFEKHRVKKQYIAIAQGSIEFDEGVIDVALGQHPRYHDRKVTSFTEQAKAAKTFYRVVKRSKGATLVKLFPETGRTHQLRVHLAHLGHPILGDEKYGRKDSFSRLALHAESIRFQHPETKEDVEFSVKPPVEFEQYY